MSAAGQHTAIREAVPLLLGVLALVAVVPQLFSRFLPPKERDHAWYYRGVRIAAFCTFCVFALYFYMQSEA